MRVTTRVNNQEHQIIMATRFYGGLVIILQRLSSEIGYGLGAHLIFWLASICVFLIIIYSLIIFLLHVIYVMLLYSQIMYTCYRHASQSYHIIYRIIHLYALVLV